jgi:hypothetical protein
MAHCLHESGFELPFRGRDCGCCPESAFEPFATEIHTRDAESILTGDQEI